MTSTNLPRQPGFPVQERGQASVPVDSRGWTQGVRDFGEHPSQPFCFGGAN